MQQEVVAPTPWHVQLWLVDVGCVSNDQAPISTPDEPTSVRVPHDDTEESIATLQQFFKEVAAILTDLTEARPLIRTELTVKSHDGGQLISGLVYGAATLDFVSEDFRIRYVLKTRKSLAKTHVRLANGQRVTSSNVCDITFEMARLEFQQTFYVLRELRDADFVVGLPLLDDEQASLQFGAKRVFTPMDGITLATQIEERRP
jgi:hypothetical protein